MKIKSHWAILLFVSDLFFVFLVWLIEEEKFKTIILTILLFSLITMVIGVWIDHQKQHKIMDKMQSYLHDPGEENKHALKTVVDESWHPLIKTASEILEEQAQKINKEQLEMLNYQEFIEAWTHQIKTPLALLTLILGNHQDEIPPYLSTRLEYVRNTINSDVERILFFARLQADHMDYKFEKIDLSDLVLHSLEDFRAIAEEKKIIIQTDFIPVQIVSDKKVLAFILSQLLSNAFKYTAAKNGIVAVKIRSEADNDQKIRLSVWDNGKGASPEDIPFLFDKGFTGRHPNRQNATGMGLYLVKKYADALSIKINIDPNSSSGQHFGIELLFPHVI